MIELQQQKRERLQREKESQLERNKKYNKLKSNIRSVLNNSSFKAVEYTKELLESNEKIMKQTADKWDVSESEIIRAYEEVMERHLEKQKEL